MGIVKIDNEKAVEVAKPHFHSILDIAESVNVQWASTNLDLCHDMDNAMGFIRNEVLEPKERNAFKRFKFHRDYKKHTKTIQLFQRELTFLSTLIESMVGAPSFMKSGIKIKMKNKKLFEDRLIEYREITAMLGGILYMQDQPDYQHVLEHEKTIIDKCMSEGTSMSGYFAKYVVFLSTFKF